MYTTILHASDPEKGEIMRDTSVVTLYPSTFPFPVMPVYSKKDF